MDAKHKAEKLMKQREAVELEIEGLIGSLESDAFLNVGMEGPLVDTQGFPLTNIDLYEVKKLRQRVRMLQNDYNEVQLVFHLHHAKKNFLRLCFTSLLPLHVVSSYP